MNLDVTVVQACRRSRRGGSRTAVVEDGDLSDAARRAVPGAVGASHAVFISGQDPSAVRLRFFTSAGELPACGHGTVAALAVLAQRSGNDRYDGVLRTAARSLPGHAIGSDGHYTASFKPGPIDLRAAAIDEADPILAALGVSTEAVACQVASVGAAASAGRARRPADAREPRPRRVPTARGHRPPRSARLLRLRDAAR